MKKGQNKSPLLPLSPVAVEAIKLAAQQPGATFASLSKQFGLSAWTIRYHIPDLQPSREKVVCPECGMKVRSLNNRIHQEGVNHTQAARVRALLATCMTYTEIGERLGITRERVRQIAAGLGQEPGMARRKTCTIKRHKRQRIQTVVKRLHPKLVARLKAAGVTDQDFGSMDNRTFVVNGKRVVISQIGRVEKQSPVGIAKYAHVRDMHYTNVVGDYLIAYVIPKDDCFVIPWNWLPQNIYIPYDRIEGYNYMDQRDWSQWLDRFDLLDIQKEDEEERDAGPGHDTELHRLDGALNFVGVGG